MKTPNHSVTCRVLVMCNLLLLLASLTVFADAELEIDKAVTTTSGSCLTAGDMLSVDARTSVLFCYTIRNVGSETAIDLQLIENNGTPEDLSDDFSVPLGITDLPAHFTLTVQYSHNVDEPGVWRYIATVSGNTGSSAGKAVKAKDDVVVRVAPVNAQLEIDKTVTAVGGSCLTAGDEITVDARTSVQFCYTIRNSGKAAASGLVLVEDNGTPSDASDDYTVALGAHISIAPNVQLMVQQTYYVDTVGAVAHTVTISGINEGTSGGTREASDSAVVTGEHVDAVIELTKSVTASGGSCLSAGSSLAAEAGSEIQFCYTIHNAGKAALLDLTLTEDSGTPNDHSDDYEVPLGIYGDLLLPQTTITIPGYATTPIPPSLGPVAYTATLEGTNDGTRGGTVSGTDAVTVTWSDTVPPVITECVDDIRVDNTWGLMGARVTLDSPTVTDSSGMTPVIGFDPASGSVFPIGTTQVLATATDAGGNTDTCTFAVTVDYVTSPRIRISIPEDGEPVILHESIAPLFHVDSVAPIDRIETTAQSDGSLNTSSPGMHEFVVTATDGEGLTATATARYAVAYLIGPRGPVEEWPIDWLFVENSLPSEARVPVGRTTLGGLFSVGDTIEVFFTLRNAQGMSQTLGVGQLSIVRVADVDDTIPGEVVAFYGIRFDESHGGYALTIPTEGWTPGIYDFLLALDDTTTRRVRVEIKEP